MEGSLLDAMRQHAAHCYPRESCGVVISTSIGLAYWPCENIAATDSHFCLKPEDYANAEDAGEVVQIVHSHPDSTPFPSVADKVACAASGVPWLIVSCPGIAWHQFNSEGYTVPLIGRDFDYGVLDCYSLCQNYYERACGISLPNFDHHEKFWETGTPLYDANYKQAGFVEVPDLQPHDAILMQIGASVANHAAIYVGDDKILHHLMTRLSALEAYRTFYRNSTVRILRHREAATFPAISIEQICEL